MANHKKQEALVMAARFKYKLSGKARVVQTLLRR
jgi:hypothetical protein